MFLGHYGLALGAKPLARKPSLGTLILAAQFADLVWPLLLLLGVEHVRIVPGLLAASPMDFTDYPFTHSLLGQCLGGAVFAAVYYARQKDARAARLLGLLVPSHWLLDLLVHRPDLPLWPSGPKVGFGLWGSIPGTLLVEAIFFGGGLLVYARSTAAKDRVGSVALWSMAAALVALYAGAVFGPAPSSPTLVAMGALSLWLFVPWGDWIDRHRNLRNAA